MELVAGRYAGRADRGTAQSAVAAASHRYLAPADAAAGAADRDHPVADRGRVLLRRFLGKAPARGRPRGAQREIAFRLQHHFDAVGDVLSSLRSLAEVAPELDQDTFEHFSRHALADHPEIFALSFNYYVTAVRRSDFEATQAKRSDVPGSRSGSGRPMGEARAGGGAG